MELIRFIFWEAAKVLGLVFLAMVAAKGVKGLTSPKAGARAAFYAVMLVLVTLGAWFVGNDVAAEVYLWSSDSSLARGDLVKAYANAIQAVNCVPNNMSYWHTLMRTKMSLHQLDSVLDDEPAMTALSGGTLDEEDEYQFSLCAFFLGQYDKVVATTLRLIRQNPSYAAALRFAGPCLHGGKEVSRSAAELLRGTPDFPRQPGGGGKSGSRLLSGRRPSASIGRAGRNGQVSLHSSGLAAIRGAERALWPVARA